MRAFFAILVGLLIVAGVFYQFVVKAKPNPALSVHNYPSKGLHIIAFGDSLISGTGASKGKDLVSLLETKTTEIIINEGVSGNTTQDGLQRINEVLYQNPKIVLVLFGGNDAIQKISPDETFKNLDTIVQKIDEKGAIVLLLGIQSGLKSDEYRQRFDALAAKYHTAYIPDILEGVIDHPSLMSDVVHPNDEGYEIIANRIAPVVENLLH
jgi:acyl-CoA thioesterase-1